MSKASKLFFVIFFILILLSIAATYYTIVVQGNYRTYTLEEEIPEPLDIYRDVFSFILNVWK